MKRNKKLVALVCCVALLVGTVGATLAWLTNQTQTVTNTFTSAELFNEPAEDFTIWEHRVYDVDGDGDYEWVNLEGETYTAAAQNDADEVTENSYEILPGVNLPKDPTVDIVNLKEHAYLYIKVTGTLPNGLTATVDSQNWTALGDAYPGIYVYSGNNADNNVIRATNADTETFTVGILESDQITVSNDYNGANNTTNNITLSFDAYMVQATGNGTDAAEAWANTYGVANN